MKPRQRVAAPVWRGFKVLFAAVVLIMALTTAPASAQDYPDGGSDQPPAVQGQEVFPAAGGTQDSGGGALAFTGTELALLVGAGVVLIAAGVVVRRRAAAREGR
jgi:hypothetical protein